MMKVLVVLLCCFALLHCTNAVEQKEDNKAPVQWSTYANALQAYVFDGGSRRDLSGEEIPKTFCAWTPETGCQFDKYGQYVAITLIPGFVVGTFLCLVLVIFCCGYTCCSSSKYSGSQKNILILKMVIIITCAVILVMLIPAFTGNARASKGMKDFSNETISFVDEIQDITAEAQAVLNGVNISSAIDLQETVTSTQELVDKGRDVQEQFVRFEGYRSDVFTAAYVILIIMCIVGIISCFIWLCCSGHINFCGGLCMILFMWVVFAIGFALGTVTTDTCKIFDEQREFEASGATTSIIDVYLGQWGANCSAFDQVLQASFDSINELQTTFCVEYEDACLNGFVESQTYCGNCTAGPDPSTVIDSTTVYNVVICPSPNCPAGFCNGGNAGTECSSGYISVQQCSQTCEIDGARTSSAQIITIAADITAVLDLMERIRPYIGCNLVYLYINRVYDPFCKSFLGGMELLVISSAIIGCVLVSFCVAMLLSIKRFNPARYLPKEGYDGVDPQRYSVDDDYEDSQGDWKKFASKKFGVGTFSGTVGFFNAKSFVVERGEEGGSQGKTGGKSRPGLGRAASSLHIKSFASINERTKYAMRGSNTNSSPLEELHQMDSPLPASNKPSAAAVFNEAEKLPSYEDVINKPPPLNPDYSSSSD